MKPVQSVQEALKQIDDFRGLAAEFTLAIPDQLNDQLGMNMAIITDKILARGWEPDGFSQMTGYRIYKYKELE